MLNVRERAYRASPWGWRGPAALDRTASYLRLAAAAARSDPREGAGGRCGTIAAEGHRSVRIAQVNRALRPLLLLAALGAALAWTAAASARPDATVPMQWQRAHPHQFRVFVVPSISPRQLAQLARRGAVGLMVPGVGSKTNRRYAVASLVRGMNINPYLHTVPAGGVLLRLSHASRIPRSTEVIIVTLPPKGRLGPNDDRYPIAVVGDAFHGLLTSPTTRIPGLVSVVDIAPTALGWLHGRLGSMRSRQPLAELAQLDRQVHANNRLKMPMLIIIAIVLALLACTFPRLALPAVLAALLTSLVAGALGIANEPLLVAVMVIGTLAGGWAIASSASSAGRLLLAIVLVLGLHYALLVLRPAWVAITPLGPTQDSRFWGIGNQLETLLLAPLIAGSAIAARRLGVIGFAAFAIFGLVLITDNRLGSDGGGAAVFGVALAITGARTLGLGRRGVVTLLLANATVALGIISLDLRHPGPNHLRSVFAHGLDGLTNVFVNRVPLAYAPALHQQLPTLVPLAVFFVLVLVFSIRTSRGRTRDLVIAAICAIVTSLLLNDSAAYVLAGGAAVLAALAKFTVPLPTVALARVPQVALAPAPVSSDE